MVSAMTAPSTAAVIWGARFSKNDAGRNNQRSTPSSSAQALLLPVQAGDDPGTVGLVGPQAAQHDDAPNAAVAQAVADGFPHRVLLR